MTTKPLWIATAMFLAVGTATIAWSQPQTTFYSFLTNAPAITNAEFEVANFIQPPDTFQTNPCTLRIDGTNNTLYRPSLGGYYVGNFGDVGWRFQGRGPLVLVDKKINSLQTYFNKTVGLSLVPVNRFMNLGIESMIPNTLIWNKGADHFTAKCSQDIGDEGNNTNVGKIDVQLQYSNGIPQSAKTRDSWGRMTLITYTYAHDFFDGKLPVSFKMVVIGANQQPIQDFKLQIQKLQLSEHSIENSQFDPMVVLGSKVRGHIVFSNNVPYGVTKRGIWQPVLTAAENQEKMAQMDERRHPQNVIGARSPLFAAALGSLVFAAVLISLLVVLMYLVWRRNKKL